MFKKTKGTMRNKFLSISIVMILLMVNSSFIAKGESENQRAKQAEKYFLAKQYDKAAPLYAQLVSSNPKSYKYNYYYGICLTIIAKDKSQALPYLDIAIQNSKTPEDIYYYMGRALHLNYQFEESLRSFAEFNNIVGARNAGRWSTPQLMEMCNNAKKILDTTKNASIMERTESMANDFYNKYTFASGNGKLLSMPDEIIQSSKSEKDERPMIFLSANGRVMYYSAMNTETSSRDIFRVEKDLENNWTVPTNVGVAINSSQDEIFPTCNTDGRILYFSSRGHNSSGGFDIFKSYYNSVSKTWSNPVNIGSPYNSPDDDFCFVSSVEDKWAYFTSQRETGPGMFTVYKVPYKNTEDLPIALNGKFNCIGQPDLKEIKLTITRDGDQNIVADILTNKTTGGYSIELPGPGTYKFLVTATGFQPHWMEVSFLEFSDNILVQDIFLSRNESGKEDLAISNRKLTDAEAIDASLTANVDENGNASSGITSADLNTANAKNSINGMSIVNDKAVINGISDVVQFKVQIGAFSKHQREVIQKRLEKNADKTMMTSYDDLKWLRFFMGSESNYLSAKNLKFTLIQAGFSDAFIVAFNGEKPIKLTDVINNKGSK